MREILNLTMGELLDCIGSTTMPINNFKLLKYLNREYRRAFEKGKITGVAPLDEKSFCRLYNDYKSKYQDNEYFIKTWNAIIRHIKSHNSIDVDYKEIHEMDAEDMNGIKSVLSNRDDIQKDYIPQKMSECSAKYLTFSFDAAILNLIDPNNNRFAPLLELNERLATEYESYTEMTAFKLCPQDEFDRYLQDSQQRYTKIYNLPLSDYYYHKIYANQQGGHFERLNDTRNTLCFKRQDYDYVSSREDAPIYPAFGVVVDILYNIGKPITTIFGAYYQRQYKLYVGEMSTTSFKAVIELDFIAYHTKMEEQLLKESEPVYEYLLDEDKKRVKQIATQYFEYLNTLPISNPTDSGLQQTPTLPAVLDTPEAHGYWNKAIESGLVDKEYKFVGTKYQMAYFAELMGDKLKLKPKWKPFTTLWDYTKFSQTRYDSKDKIGKVNGSKEIDNIFK